MSVRCRLGHHTYKPAPTLVERPNAWTSTWTNAACVRCGRRIWLNWERQAALEQVADAAREVVNDGTSRTALARLWATVEACDAQDAKT